MELWFPINGLDGKLWLQTLLIEGYPPWKLTASLHLKMDAWKTIRLPFGVSAYFQMLRFLVSFRGEFFGDLSRPRKSIHRWSTTASGILSTRHQTWWGISRVISCGWWKNWEIRMVHMKFGTTGLIAGGKIAYIIAIPWYMYIYMCVCYTNINIYIHMFIYYWYHYYISMYLAY